MDARGRHDHEHHGRKHSIVRDILHPNHALERKKYEPVSARHLVAQYLAI